MRNPNSALRGEADRLLAIAEKLLETRDLVGARDFAILAQETEPLLEGSDQILAVSEVLISSEKRVNDHHHYWYSILQIERQSDDLDLIRKQYRRLALLLHPDKNKFPFADHAFELVTDAWATLSDPARKSQFDQLLIPFPTEELESGRAQSQFSQQQESQGFQMDFRTQQDQQNVKLPVRRGESDSRNKNGSARGANGNVNDNLSFWTACPYCYVLYEYPRVYEGCCLRCQSCQRAFHGAEIPALPPRVSGKESYYCCWANFPVGIKSSESGSGGNKFPNWMPPMFNSNGSNISSNHLPVQQNLQTPLHHPQMQARQGTPQRMSMEMSFGVRSFADGSTKKRGRPRKSYCNQNLGFVEQ